MPPIFIIKERRDTMLAAAYARYSTDKQTENSIAYQMSKIESYCSEHNILIGAKYIDEGFSGTNTMRQGFQQMVTDAAAHRFDAVVIYDISRGSRDVADWFIFRKKMAAAGVKVISCTQNLGDIYNSNDFLIELISVGLGQREVLETRQKSIDGVKAKAQQAAFLGGVPPFGYDVVNQKYIINPAEAEIVKKIFEMYASGESYDSILSVLDGKRGKRGRPFGKNSLQCILTNERYIGTYFWNKRKNKLFREWAGGGKNENAVIIPDAIPAIIDKNTWRLVQMRINDNKQNGANTAKRDYLLSGLIKCGLYGGSYTGHVSTRKKNGVIYKNAYYVCSTKSRTKQCKAQNVNADDLEIFVVQALKEYLKNANYDDIANDIMARISNASKDIVAEKNELNEIETKISNGVKAIVNGMSFPELQDEIDRLRGRRSELIKIINAVENSPAPTINRNDIINAMRQAAENIDSADKAQLKMLIKTFVSEIVVNADGSAVVYVGINLDIEKRRTTNCAPFANCGGRI